MKMGVKLVFLDVDGVLNCQFTEDRCDGYIGIDDKYVTNLAKIVNAFDNVLIVLSSTWRLGFTRYGQELSNHRRYLNDKLAKQGLVIYDSTPELSRSGEARGYEIYTWLQQHNDLDIESWVVLDDEYFYDFNQYVGDHLVETYYYSEYGGLSDEKVKEAIEVLRRVKDEGC